jgi:hypothetical protein
MEPTPRRLPTEAREELRGLLRRLIALQCEFEQYAERRPLEARLSGSVHNQLSSARWALTMMVDERKLAREDIEIETSEA